MATVIIDENTPHDGTGFEAFDEGKTALRRRAAAVNVFTWTGSLKPTWGSGTYSNTSGDRYIWDYNGLNLYGSFAANVPGLATFNGEKWYQSEATATNDSPVVSSWTLQGVATRVAGAIDPIGGTGAYDISVWTGANGIFGQKIGAPADAPFEVSFFIRKGTSTGNMWVQNPTDSNIGGKWNLDLSLLGTGWERVTENHPAVTVTTPFKYLASGAGGIWFLSNASGTLEFSLWQPQFERGTDYSSSPVAEASTRNADSMIFSATHSDFYSGGWSTKIIPEHSSSNVTGSSASPAYLFWFDVNNYLVLTGSGGSTYLKLATDGGAISQSLTYAPNVPLTCSVNFGLKTLTVEGALSGNGIVSGTLSNWPSTGSLYVGSDGTPDNHLFGLISEPFTRVIPVHRGVPSDLAEVNAFRQGVEITTEAYRVQGAGPKIWAGNIKGYTLVRTLGQAPSFTDYQNDKTFVDQQRFDPVEYIDNPNYPFPITFNDGPQAVREGSIQAFSIPFWRYNNEDSDTLSHAARGNVEDGNPDTSELKGSNNRIKQFIHFNETGLVPFLDEGGSYYGPAAESVVHESYINARTELFDPYDDMGNEKLIDKLNTTNNTLISILRLSSSLNLDNDIRGTHGVRSAAAGGDSYGPSQAQYGTDSISFAGFYKGS